MKIVVIRKIILAAVFHFSLRQFLINSDGVHQTLSSGGSAVDRVWFSLEFFFSGCWKSKLLKCDGEVLPPCHFRGLHTYGYCWNAHTNLIILRYLSPLKSTTLKKEITVERFVTFQSLSKVLRHYIMTYFNISTKLLGADTYQWEFADLNVELRNFCLCNSDLTSCAVLVTLQIGSQPVPLQLPARIEAVVNIIYTLNTQHTHTHELNHCQCKKIQLKA